MSAQLNLLANRGPSRESGMSLVELMIALGATSALVVLLLSLMGDMGKIMVRGRAIGAISSETGLLKKRLRGIDFCTGALADTPFTPDGKKQTLPNAALTNLGMIFVSNENVKPVTAQLQSSGKLESYQVNGVDAYELHKANLIFRYETAQETTGGTSLKDRVVPIQVIVELAGSKIVSCIDDFGDISSKCSLIGGTFDPSKMPPCQLPIFKKDCAGLTVAEGIAAAGFNCATPPSPPTGPATTPPPRLNGKVYITTETFGCYPNNCTCPERTFPVSGGNAGVVRVTVGPAGPGITCGRYDYLPPSRTFAEKLACLTLADKADPTQATSVRLGTEVIRHGFGPSFNCP